MKTKTLPFEDILYFSEFELGKKYWCKITRSNDSVPQYGYLTYVGPMVNSQPLHPGSNEHLIIPKFSGMFEAGLVLNIEVLTDLT